MAKLGSGLGTETKAKSNGTSAAAATAATVSSKTTAKASSGPIDFSGFLKSSSDTTLDGDILVHGPPGVGKTFFAGTASEFWPADLTVMKKRCNLDDMLWLQIDAGATAGFAEAGIDLRGRVIDMSGAIAEYGLLKGMAGCLDLMDLALSTNPATFVVVDTISMLDKLIVEYYEARTPISERTGEPDGWWAFKQILIAHRRVHARLHNNKAKPIWLCHSKVQGEAVGKNSQLQREAKAVPGGFDIIPEITGQARTLYVGNCSIEGVLKARVLPGPKRVMQRFFYPFGVNASEGKTRFQKALKREEGPNPRLADLFARIRLASEDGASVTASPDTTTNVYDE